MTTEFHDVQSWADCLSGTAIPVLKSTAREIGKLQVDIDRIGTREVAHVCNYDPLMAFKVLRYMQTHKNRHQVQDLVLVEQAIMMMGMSTFFRNIPPTPVAEDVLKNNLPALTCLMRLINRSRNAAHYSTEFAKVLNDLHVQEIRIAALLHELSEMLLWCFAPDKMMEIYQMQHADKTIRSHAAQTKVFGFHFGELQLKLVHQCQLPPLLEMMMDEHSVNEQRVRIVMLAVNVARHSANGWEDAALPDDYKDIAKLLRMDVKHAKKIVGAPEEVLWI